VIFRRSFSAFIYVCQYVYVLPDLRIQIKNLRKNLFKQKEKKKVKSSQFWVVFCFTAFLSKIARKIWKRSEKKFRFAKNKSILIFLIN